MSELRSHRVATRTGGTGRSRERRLGAATGLAMLVMLAGCTPTPPATAGRWCTGPPTGLPAALAAASCSPAATVAAASCLVVATDNRVLRWEDNVASPAPAAPGTTGNGAGPVELSCAGPSLCALAEANGRIPVFDGTAWTADQVLETEDSPAAVSCPAPGTCRAVDDGGRALSFAGTWSSPETIPGAGTFVGLSCTSLVFCLAVTSDSPPGVFRLDGSAWRTVAAPAPSTPRGGSEPDVLNDVSCASPRWCVAVDTFGEFFVWDGSRWSAPQRFADLQDAEAEVSCHAVSLCMVVDEDGGATAIADGRAGARQVLSHRETALVAVSCPSPDGCVAAGDDGKVYTFTVDQR